MYRPNAPVDRVQKIIGPSGVNYIVEFKDGERVHVTREEVKLYMDKAKSITCDVVAGVSIITFK